jgi:hypothetical protein
MDRRTFVGTLTLGLLAALATQQVGEIPRRAHLIVQ